MAITKETLEAQIAQLSKQREDFLGKANAADGALALARHLLAQLDDDAKDEVEADAVGDKD